MTPSPTKPRGGDRDRDREGSNRDPSPSYNGGGGGMSANVNLSLNGTGIGTGTGTGTVTAVGTGGVNNASFNVNSNGMRQKDRGRERDTSPGRTLPPVGNSVVEGRSLSSSPPTTKARPGPMGTSPTAQPFLAPINLAQTSVNPRASGGGGTQFQVEIHRPKLTTTATAHCGEVHCDTAEGRASENPGSPIKSKPLQPSSPSSPFKTYTPASPQMNVSTPPVNMATDLESSDTASSCSSHSNDALGQSSSSSSSQMSLSGALIPDSTVASDGVTMTEGREEMSDNHPTASSVGNGEARNCPRTAVKNIDGEDTEGYTVKNFLLGKDLGAGATGKVKLGLHKDNGYKVAIKMIDKDNMKDKVTAQKKILREIGLHRLIDHPHVLKLYDVYETNRYLMLILEYAEGGDLFNYVRHCPVVLSEAQRIFQQLIYGLEYCHAIGISHRDLKLDKQRNVKIADFGMSALMINNHLLVTSYDIPQGSSYEGKPSDIWSCGVILYALTTVEYYGKLPFTAADGNTREVVKDGLYSLPPDMHPDLRGLISSMLVVNPAHRITVEGIKRNPWFMSSGYHPIPVPLEDHTPPLRSCEIDTNILQTLSSFGVGTVEEIYSALTYTDISANNVIRAYYRILLRRCSHQFPEYQKGCSPPKSDCNEIKAAAKHGWSSVFENFRPLSRPLTYPSTLAPNDLHSAIRTVLLNLGFHIHTETSTDSIYRATYNTPLAGGSLSIVVLIHTVQVRGLNFFIEVRMENGSNRLWEIISTLFHIENKL
ncbi:CAMK/CAMKL/BRSK protein kinase [Pelomyxa schiedti]|nr:CAMK/CAMKL/BRSK protein kinase [Pelomyxa schiedti]